MSVGRRYGHCGGFRGFAVTGNVHLMADVANIAGGLVCEEVGTVAINKSRLLQECKHLLQ